MTLFLFLLFIFLIFKNYSFFNKSNFNKRVIGLILFFAYAVIGKFIILNSIWLLPLDQLTLDYDLSFAFFPTLILFKGDLKGKKPKIAKPLANTGSGESISNNLDSPNFTSIVVWGTNLSTNVGYPRFSPLVSNMVILPSQMLSLFTGLLLSDGWLFLASKRSINACFGFSQSFAHFGYLWHVFTLLAHYCSSYPALRIRMRLGTVTLSLQFFTRSLPCLTALFNLWYFNGRKIIPANIFHDLTPLALAHWIMGDGTAHNNGLVLCTDSNSLEEVIRLMNVLMIKYDLICSIHTKRPGQYRIYISVKSMDKVRELVKPYMVNSMLYKIGL